MAKKSRKRGSKTKPRKVSKPQIKKKIAAKKPVSKGKKTAGEKKGKGKKPKGVVLQKKTAAGKRKLSGTKADNKLFYNDLKKSVAEYYQKELGKKHVDRTFLESKTKYLFKALKAQAPGGIINNSVFKGFVNNLEFISSKPATSVLQQDLINETGLSLQWWNLEPWIDQNGAQLEGFESFEIIASDIIGAGNDQQADSVSGLDIKGVIRDIGQAMRRMGLKGKSDFLYWDILKSKDGKTIVFQLSTSEPSNIMLPDKDGEFDEVELPEFEEESAAKAEPAKEEPVKETPTQKRKGELDILTSKKESFQKDIEFNNKQIKDIAETIKLLKELGIPIKEEKKRLVELSKENGELSKSISEINKKIKDL